MATPHRALTVLVILAALEAGRTTIGAQAPGIDELLARVGERIADFYTRAQHVIATEVSTVQPIDLSRSTRDSRGPSNRSCTSKQTASMMVARHE